MASPNDDAYPKQNWLPTYAPLPSVGFVRLPTILQHIPVARSTWWEGVRTGRFPKPVRIGGVTAWRAEDIHALITRISETGMPRPCSSKTEAA